MFVASSGKRSAALAGFALDVTVGAGAARLRVAGGSESQLASGPHEPLDLGVPSVRPSAVTGRRRERLEPSEQTYGVGSAPTVHFCSNRPETLSYQTAHPQYAGSTKSGEWRTVHRSR